MPFLGFISWAMRVASGSRREQQEHVSLPNVHNVSIRLTAKRKAKDLRETLKTGEENFIL